ncbi:hypothetical protein Pcinc_011906 [Petrolisthes cinctipes]|uniref:Uncharacterized protein n=1 Tax=Petrolisthes cinctipes TaxID=88211 RepID=A0AAE1G1S4_PETCI|nr:hypothetical protein Pcinc_011906 [Petrolisthes cinctipes]
MRRDGAPNGTQTDLGGKHVVVEIENGKQREINGKMGEMWRGGEKVGHRGWRGRGRTCRMRKEEVRTRIEGVACRGVRFRDEIWRVVQLVHVERRVEWWWYVDLLGEWSSKLQPHTTGTDTTTSYTSPRHHIHRQLEALSRKVEQLQPPPAPQQHNWPYLNTHCPLLIGSYHHRHGNNPGMTLNSVHITSGLDLMHGIDTHHTCHRLHPSPHLFRATCQLTCPSFNLHRHHRQDGCHPSLSYNPMLSDTPVSLSHHQLPHLPNSPVGGGPGVRRAVFRRLRI